MQTEQQEQICVIGLGYVGLTLAISLANVGFRVHGVEINQKFIDDLNAQRPFFYEEGLASHLKVAINSGNFTFSKSWQEIPYKPTTFIITVGTPLGNDHIIRLDMIKNAATEVANTMPDNALVILRSTVKIGTARDVIKPILEKSNLSFQIAMCPERTLEGSALKELRSLPQIIGADDTQTRERCAGIFGRLTPTTLKVSSLETAELIKLVDNTYRDVIFSFGNEVARICDAIGVNAYEVINAGKLGYPRTNVALPGLVGGPCLEKDPHILEQSVENFGITLDVTSAARNVNERQPQEAVDFLEKVFLARKGKAPEKIVMAGLTFKGYPETDDLRGSMSLKVLAALKAKFPDAEYFGYDPNLNQAKIEALNLKFINKIEDELSDKDLVVIGNNHPYFRRLSLPGLLEKASTEIVVYDFWNNFDSDNLEQYSKNYLAIGYHKVFKHTI